ncbi:shikimate kinase [Chloroflexota bacterium]
MKVDSIIFIGMAGVGKSTIGTVVAKALGFSFTDLDDYIVEKEQKTIQEIIDSEGGEGFLQVEKRRMNEISLTRRVVAPGGSIIYHRDLMQSLKKNATLVYLDDTFKNIQNNLDGMAEFRGIVGLKDKSLRQVYNERKYLYSKYADITVKCEGKSPGELSREILIQFLEMENG